MTPAETAALLAVAASFDNRKPDELATDSWWRVLNKFRFEDCRDAVVEHYTSSNQWLMPADVGAIVKRRRAKRIDEHPPLVPPPGLDDAAERAWLAEATRRVGDGEQVETGDLYDQLPEDLPRVRELIAAVQLPAMEE